jgi:hypothetical protein
LGSKSEGDDIVISTLATNAPIQVDQGASLVNIIPITFCSDWHCKSLTSVDLPFISGALMIIATKYRCDLQRKTRIGHEQSVFQSLIEINRKILVFPILFLHKA